MKSKNIIRAVIASVMILALAFATVGCGSKDSAATTKAGAGTSAASNAAATVGSTATTVATTKK